jgi:hypothetical protein
LVEGEVKFMVAKPYFVVVLVPGDHPPISMRPMTDDAAAGYRQYLLVAALPCITEKLASDAVVMAYPLPHGATLSDPNVDQQAVRAAIGDAETSRILEAPLPEELVASLA